MTGMKIRAGVADRRKESYECCFSHCIQQVVLLISETWHSRWNYRFKKSSCGLPNQKKFVILQAVTLYPKQNK